MDIDFSVTKPQALFHQSETQYTLFVAGYGAGKTEAMINQAIMDALVHPKALIALYAPINSLLTANVVPRLIERLEDFGIDVIHNKMEQTIKPQCDQMGSFILRSLDTPERIVGYEVFRSHVDELDTMATLKANDAWTKIIARNRQKIIVEGVRQENKVGAYTTPEGHRFCYQRWIAIKSELYGHISAPSYSNPYLPDGYLDSLYETYPEALARAYIEGEFTNLQGGSVYHEYNRDRHSSDEVIRPGETLYIGCDFNVTKQAATVFVRRDGGAQWHAVEELCDMLDTPEMIYVIKNRYGGHHIVIYPDASGAARKTVNASETDIALLKQAGFEVRVNAANPKVKDRILATNVAFSKDKLFVNYKKAPTVAKCLEQQGYNKNGEPDKASGQDHQNDATTYPIAYEMAVHKPIARIQFGVVS